jgi:hypothetical protein
MFGSVVLEVAFGLVSVYLLLSLLCSAAKEGLEALIKKRAIDLERGIREMLNDPGRDGMVQRLYDHPHINGLFKGSYAKQSRFWTTLPSYIPAETFALALVDVILRGTPGAVPPPGGSGGEAVQQLRRAINDQRHPEQRAGEGGAAGPGDAP